MEMPWDCGRRHGSAGVPAGETWGSGRPVRAFINDRGQRPLQLMGAINRARFIY